MDNSEADRAERERLLLEKKARKNPGRVQKQARQGANTWRDWVEDDEEGDDPS